MVRALLAMDETPEPADAADALAVALCHLQADQVRRRFDIATSSPRPNAGRAAAATSPTPPRISILR
jgi:hypothetical protein